MTLMVPRTRGLLATTVYSFLRSSTSAFCVGRSFAVSSFPSSSHSHENSCTSSSVTRRMSTTTSSTAAAAAEDAICQEVAGDVNSNPLLSDWSTQPFFMPPFSAIQTEHFAPALQAAMEAHLQDLQMLVDQGSDDDNDAEVNLFEKTVVAYDRAGVLLDRVGSVFSNLCSSQNTPELQAVQTEWAPKLARHESAVTQFPGLYARIQAIYAKRHELTLTPEQLRLVERIHTDFVRAGAALDQELQDELAMIQAQLATLTTQFTQNVMKDEELWELVLTKDDMSGCPESLVQAAQGAAQERDKPEGAYVITLSRSLVEPFLTYSDRRDLRETAWQAWVRRGELDTERDNLTIAVSILKLRKRIAEIHGYPSYAAYQCADRMAQTPEAVMELLENVWERAKLVANQERQAMQDFCQAEGMTFENGIQPYDWRYVAEKVRMHQYDLDDALVKPYFSLERVREALFAVSGNLFGLQYKKRPDLKVYHPDVDTYEVREPTVDGGDRLVSLFVHDNYARPFKSSGAWMSEYRSQTRNLGPGVDEMEGIPIVSNNNNFAKSSGQDTLLSFDDATTMFHEFGHAHHGMLSDSDFSSLASTNVMTDFVELPSQLMEHWFHQPQVLKQYARHYETNEPIPDELLEKLHAARLFQQGFKTVEYSACALMDIALHQVENCDDNFDLAAFEKAELERLGMPEGIVMRHRPAHFLHLFATSMYAAGYYVYQWAEVLDADAFAAFEEAGDIFDKDTAARARKLIYGAGNTRAPDELFREFRGRDPDIQFMLKKKGLLKES